MRSTVVRANLLMSFLVLAPLCGAYKRATAAPTIAPANKNTAASLISFSAILLFPFLPVTLVAHPVRGFVRIPVVAFAFSGRLQCRLRLLPRELFGFSFILNRY